MFKRFFGSRHSAKQVRRATYAKRVRRLGIEPLEGRDLLAPAPVFIQLDRLTGITTEAGGTDTFHVRLTQQPTADVTLNLGTFNSHEGVISSPKKPFTLTFTHDNFDTFQAFTVKGVGDKVVGDDTQYEVGGTTQSTDPNFNELSMPHITLTNLDKTHIGGFVAKMSKAKTTTEEGGTFTMSVQLNFQPTSNVILNLHSSNTAEGVLDVDQLVFTPQDWNTDHVTHMIGQPDGVKDGNQKYQLTFDPVTSDDVHFSGRQLKSIDLTNQDKVPAILVTLPKGAKQLTTFEDPPPMNVLPAQFSVRLSQQPIPGSTVVVNLHSSNTAAGTIDMSQLTFTPANWNVPQVVTVTGHEDGLLLKTDVKYTIVTDAAVSTDPKYANLDPADVKVTNKRSTLLDRFDGHYVGDLSNGTVSIPTQPTISFSAHLDAMIQGGMVDATLQLFGLGLALGSDPFTAHGTGTVDKNGKLTFHFDQNAGLLAGKGVNKVSIVGDQTGVPTLTAKGATFTFPIDFGNFHVTGTAKFDLNLQKEQII